MRILSIAVGDSNKNVMRFVDDILVAIENYEHIRDLQWLFDRLSHANLTIQINKCELFKHNIVFRCNFIHYWDKAGSCKVVDNC